ncbi:MAG: CHAT domain-containing protein [Cyanobacteria bacterium P01_B01_bin.77]
MGNYFKKLGLSLWLGLFLCGLLLTSTAVPVLSQTTISNRGYELLTAGQHQLQRGQASDAIRQWQAAEQYYRELNDMPKLLYSQLLQTEALQQLGLYPQACGLLMQIIDFQTGSEPAPFLPQALCQDQEITKNLLLNTGDNFQKQPDRFKVATLRSLGVVLRGLGRLKESEHVLRNELGRNDAATLLSLGNTLRARGNLVRDRITPPNYDAMPWRFEKLTSLDGDDIEDANQALSDCAISQIEADAGDACEAQINHEDESYAKVVAYYQTAKNKYQQAASNNEGASKSLEVKTQLNQLAILSELMRLSGNNINMLWVSESRDLIDQVLKGLDTLPEGYDRVFSQINLAKQWAFLQAYVDNGQDLNSVETLLCKADQDAIVLTLDSQTNACKPATDRVNNGSSNLNLRFRSYMLGSLGGFYEYRAFLAEGNAQTKQHAKTDDLRRQAISFTEQALLLAQPADAPDVAYQWQWQLGRLQAKQAHREDAIANYEQALETLSMIRGDLIGTTRTTQFSFRDNVEPVYRQLIDLKLTSQEPSQKELQDAVNLVDFLQIAELENFFNCNLSQVAKLDQQSIDENAAVIYPIFLKDRLSVILSTQDNEFYYHSHPLNIKPSTADSITIRQLVQRFEKSLKSPSGFRAAQRDGSLIYDLIFQPFEQQETISRFTGLRHQNKSNTTDTTNHPIKTVVFVPDGELRNIPMAALWDSREQAYLIEKYAVAVAPGLKLLTANRLPDNASILIGGSDEQLVNPLTNKPFPILSKVGDEKDAIQTRFSPREVVIFNQDFTKANLAKSLAKGKFDIIHFATHGQFSSDPQKTFIALSDGALYAEDLDSLISLQEREGNEIQMLVLSACSTADGDRHATLGMAGLTIRSGSRSTLATLWPVYDNIASELMEKFYENTTSEIRMSKAEALQKAQISIIQKTGTKLEWAPFTLVGNWL